MGIIWDSWTGVSEGSTLPGAPVAAVRWEESFALFLADPNGGIYTIKAEPGFGWTPLALATGKAKPGGQITALASRGGFTLFMADSTGEVVETHGIPYQTWEPWTKVSPGNPGTTLPGAPVAAVPWGNTFAVFRSDPNGAIFTIQTGPISTWQPIPGRNTKPDGQIMAVASRKNITLFMAADTGEVFTTSGVPNGVWAQWTSVSQGSTLPGAPIAAVPWEDSVALFLADPNGGVYTIKAIPGFGWSPVALATGKSKPGGQITVVPRKDEPGFLLFMADVNGGIVQTSGTPYEVWDPWTAVSDGSSTPGATVTGLWTDRFHRATLFMANSRGEVQRASPQME
jgi:hypothetical protein